MSAMDVLRAWILQSHSALHPRGNNYELLWKLFTNVSKAT